jgi:hypothetical protein
MTLDNRIKDLATAIAQDIKGIEDKLNNNLFLMEEGMEWIIDHNQDRYPGVTITDPDGNTVEGDIRYVNANRIILSSEVVFSGIAYLN